MKRSELIFGLLRIPLDFAMVLLGFLLGYQLRLQGDFIPGREYLLNPNELMPLQEYLGYALLFAGMLILVFGASGLYQLKSNNSILHEIRRMAGSSIVWILLMMSTFFITGETVFSRLAFGYSALIAILLIVIARFIMKEIQIALLRFGIGKQNVLLIGDNKISKALAKEFERDLEHNLVGILKYGRIKDLQKKAEKHSIDEVILTSQNLNNLEDHDILEFCQQKHIAYRFVPDILELERTNVEVHMRAGYTLIHLKPTPLEAWGKVAKRIFDFTAASLGLLILSPLFALVAIAIKLDSKGPVFFIKLDDGSPAYRIGEKGRKFVFYKFRTMRDKCHNMRYQELAEKDQRGGPLVKIKDDPRITKLGKFLRRFDIDELPQLWNVLKGDMSLVGPRPHLPEEVAKYEDHHRFLLTIKPGITGLSQISGRSDLDFEDEVQLDTTYIRQWTLWLDLKILLRTLPVVLKGHAAEQ